MQAIIIFLLYHHYTTPKTLDSTYTNNKYRAVLIPAVLLPNQIVTQVLLLLLLLLLLDPAYYDGTTSIKYSPHTWAAVAIGIPPITASSSSSREILIWINNNNYIHVHIHQEYRVDMMDNTNIINIYPSTKTTMSKNTDTDKSTNVLGSARNIIKTETIVVVKSRHCYR